PPEYPPSQPSRKTRSKRNTKSSTLTAQNVGFYPAHWRIVIENAKIHYCASILHHDAFPTIPDGRQEAADGLREALESHRKKGNNVEEGIQGIVNLYTTTLLNTLQTSKYQ